MLYLNRVFENLFSPLDRLPKNIGYLFFPLFRKQKVKEMIQNVM